ncbi:MAG: serine hydrolase [Bacteroidales bacterium]|jgi:beta-glucosidase-like glycosyl hydrolase/CubicO group peptidase (beta-lactamase class C family)|nr:serine hydrolase [Bacteroidales bacterium]
MNIHKYMLAAWGILTALCADAAVTSDSLRRTFPFDDLHTPWVDSVYNSLTAEQRIGQLLLVAAYSNKDQAHVDQVSECVEKYRIGGLIFFQGGPKRQVLLTNYYQRLSQTPLLIAMDAEWGLGMRLDSCISFPRSMPLGAVEDLDLIYSMGREIGMQCRRMGVHLNFAPVTDINNQPSNPVIGIRSFGENRDEVTRRSIPYMSGLQDEHVLAAAKHFPGHGNTVSDSHHSLPVTGDSYRSLDTLEWVPYRELIRRELTGVLAAHIHVPALDSTPNLAASLSRRVLTEILRDSLKFKGLIYTDALNMKGVSRFFSPGELEIRALQAGADVLLMPDNVPVAIAAVKAAIDSGRIDSKQIELSCRRILAAKQWAGLNRYQPTDTTALMADLHCSEAELLNRRLTESSLTVVQNVQEIIPLKELDRSRTAVLLTGISLPNRFLQTLALYEENDYYFFNEDTSPELEKELAETLNNYTRVIVGVHNTRYHTNGRYGIAPRVFSLVDRLADNTRVILCLFAPPYALSNFTGAGKMHAIVVAYQDTPLFQDCAAQLLYGAHPATGTLPVSVGASFPSGKGISFAGGLRLRYSIPEDVGMSSRKLLSIDTMTLAAIESGAMPGCQIVAARNGTVFFSKEYGQTRYDGDADPVHPKHIYDLASVTKIAATIPAMMLLYDRDEIKLRDRLDKHLAFPKDSEPARITLADLLTHQARLPAFIPFHLTVMEPIDSSETLISRSQDKHHSIRLSAGSWLNARRKFKDGYLSSSENEFHRAQAAPDMYVLTSYRDTIFNRIKQLTLSPQKQYRYSDLGFILLTELIEQKSGWTADEYVSLNFYRRLGATSLGYLPLKRFPKERIVPTANDTVFRNQWLQGTVHDENAALMGGVSGHAGLFGNANDLAKLMQMYLNKGMYGGERYMEEKTVEDFTACHFCKQGNRRGIGFDKPEPDPKKQNPACSCASPESYGHSGFTGTYVWMDPQTGLLLVFLSNRVCPDPSNNKLITSNLRTRIYQALADAMEN